jgi:hypothetical protein
MFPVPANELTEGTIAGTAAAVICFVVSTIESFCVAQDKISDDALSGSKIAWHPKIFEDHAMAERMRSPQCDAATE